MLFYQDETVRYLTYMGNKLNNYIHLVKSIQSILLLYFDSIINDSDKQFMNLNRIPNKIIIMIIMYLLHSISVVQVRKYEYLFYRHLKMAKSHGPLDTIIL